MCGIAGYVRKDGSPVPRRVIAAMTDAVAHRGPDGSGLYTDRNVALGHRRLAIIDLTTVARQPMADREGRCVITYNGEVYNYPELREELEGMGHVFRSESDTEVILAAYAEWNEECVQRFNGMWSFVIYDRKRRVLFGSRDRFGVKPFYYLQDAGCFAFSSEIRQLLPLLPVVRADGGLVLDFLLTGFSDHTNRTFFKGVGKLAAATNLVYWVDNGALRTWRYYEIRARNDLQCVPEEEAVRLCRDLLGDSVRLRLRSDVRVGTCLSGGLDSSSVATLARRVYGQAARFPFSAITAVSEQAANDESEFAAQVVSRCGLDWIRTKPTYQDFREALGRVAQAQEEPFGSPSIFMQFFVMRASREHGIKVLLDGQGGDETMLGYPRYYPTYYISLLRRAGVFGALRGVRCSLANHASMSLASSLKYSIGGLSAPLRYWFNRRKQPFLYAPRKTPRVLAAYARAGFDAFMLQKLEIESTCLPALLRFEDKNSMAHGVEARLPFLDYRLVEIALSLPCVFKIHDGWTKWMLRKAMVGEMPDEIVWRRDKIGFEAPDALWLKQHQEEMIEVVGQSSVLRSMADMAGLCGNYPYQDARAQWRLYSVALWEKTFGVRP